jgi:phosphoribosylanthranilate isomerase
MNRAFKIKVCGMRDAANIAALSALPIDYFGFIFYEASPRFVERYVELSGIQQQKVGVFVNASLDLVGQKIHDYALDVVQLHGAETPQYLDTLKENEPTTKIWKAFAVDATFDFDTTNAYDGRADMFLFDTKTPKHGGTGQKFDWTILEKYKGNTPFLLAGGIAPDDALAVKNIFEKMDTIYGVDLNSRFETAPAVKDVVLLEHFIHACRDKARLV